MSPVCGSEAAAPDLGWSPARSDLPAMIADSWRGDQRIGWDRNRPGGPALG